MTMNYLKVDKSFLKQHGLTKKTEKIVNRKWREDLKKWETKKHFLNLIPYYQYSIWKEGKLRTRTSLFKKHKRSASYSTFMPLAPIRIGKIELKEKYNDNKWSVPVNLIFDPNLP